MVCSHFITYLHFLSFLVVDQPAGTGFSLVSTDRFVHTLEEVRDFHERRPR
jgi:carboxypeptidase C (cathepsin A)